MLGEALSYPRRNDDWFVTTLIGGVLILLSFLVLPAFVVQGYLVRVLREVGRGEVAEAPSFTEWGELLVDGLKLFVVTFVYGIVVGVPVLVLLTLTGGLAVGMGPRMAGPVALVGGLVVFVAVLVVGYFVPAGLTNFAVEDSMGAAFRPGVLADVALTGAYAGAWLRALAVGIVGGIVAGLLSTIVIGVFVSFYVQVSTYFLFARGYAAARGSDASGGGSTPDEGAPGEPDDEFEFPAD